MRFETGNPTKRMSPRLGWFSVVVFFLVFAAGLSAQNELTPDLINYPGLLLDGTGTPIADGDHEIDFRIFDVLAGGTALWGPQEFDAEGGTGHAPLVTTVGGRFNVVLGPVDTADASLMDAIRVQSQSGGDVFLEIAVGGSVLGARQQILSAPFAAIAGNGPPPGSIIMWSGASVPRGWLLCDGTNGTPDLRNQFVKSTPVVGTHVAGGSASHSHTLSAHNHGSSHTHAYGHVHSTAGHFHIADPPNTNTSSHNPANFDADVSIFGLSYVATHSHTFNIPAIISSVAAFPTDSQSPTTSGASSPSLAGTSAAVGVTSESNVPFHYRLAFLMKI